MRALSRVTGIASIAFELGVTFLAFRTAATPDAAQDVESALPGDFAFPMFARNRLSGLLVCDGKADGAAAYAPDELDAIGSVASAAGLALDLLRIESLERELEALRPVNAAEARSGRTR